MSIDSGALVKLHTAPGGEEIDPHRGNVPDGPPFCEEGYGERTFAVGGRNLRLKWDAGSMGPSRVAIYEQGRRLWSADQASAGGADPYACVRDDWHVVFAGQSRIGETAYDVFTGKIMARTQGGLVVSPDAKWALTPPPRQWTNGCFERSRSFRIPLDGSGPAHSIPTGPVPQRELWDGGGACTWLVPGLAISRSGTYYAFDAPWELSIFRASDDVRLAAVAKPGDVVGVWFSKSEKFLVADMQNGERVWYRIVLARGPA